MDWTRAVDGYCERLGPGYWAEPLNALTNLAFLLAAAVMWRRCAGLATGRVLAGILFAIGIGSWLFHTHAQAWAGVADVLPIVIFIIAYIFVANRDYVALGTGKAVGATVLAVAFVPLLARAFALLPWLGGSAGYAPVPVLIAGYGVGLHRRLPDVARGLWVGAGLLVLSLTFRTLDMPLCAAWPSGTHLLWHLINAVMLGWMIEVWRRWKTAAG